MTTDSSARDTKLEDILVQADIVHEHQMPRALKYAEERSMPLSQVLINMRYLSLDEIDPIEDMHRMVVEGTVSAEEAVKALKTIRRDGLPLARALDVVQAEVQDKEPKEMALKAALAELLMAENQPSVAERDLVPLLMKLGQTKADLRRWDEAEAHYRRGLSIVEHSHGPKNVKAVPVIVKLIELYLLQQRYTDAEPLCWKLVEINQAAFGADHLEVARSLQRLARIMDAQTRYPEAEQFLLSTLRIMEKQLPPDNPELKATLRHLSAFWKRKTKQAEHKRIGELLIDAELLSFDNLTAALQQAHKTNTPLGQTLVSLNMINHDVLRAGLQAQLMVQDGVVPSSVAIKALALVGHKGVEFESALEEIGWSSDPSSTSDLENLLDTTDELMAAEKVFGPNHPSVAAMLIKLGEQYAYAQKFAYAENSYKRALTILKGCWGQNNAELATCMFNLANLYFAQKRYTEAESLHWQVLEMRKATLGEDHAEVAQSLEQIARLQETQGNDMLATQMRTAAALIKSKNSEKRKAILQFLKEKTVFKTIDDKMIDRVSGLVEEKQYGAGQVVLQDRQEPEALWVVYTGSVELAQTGGAPMYLAAGDVFGDLLYPHSDTHIGAVRVPEEAVLLKLATPVIRELKAKYAQLQAQLERIEQERNQGTNSNQGLTLQGNLAFFDLTTVLQTISSKEGVLKLTNHKKQEVATICVKDGQLVFAKYRHLQGQWAIYDMLSRNDALDFVFEPGTVDVVRDNALASRPLMMLLMEAARRSDEIPGLIETVGWPASEFHRNARVLDSSRFDPDVASVAADIWMLLDEGADNEKIADGVYADRYIFLIAMKELLAHNLIRKEPSTAGGAKPADEKAAPAEAKSQQEAAAG